MIENFSRFKDPIREIREREINQALEEARAIVDEYGLPEKAQPRNFYNTVELLPRHLQERDDSPRVVLRIPKALFPNLVDEKKPEYVYEWSHPGDDTGGYGTKNVWFNTESKLRILMETSPIDDGFMENIVYPSYLAQLDELTKEMGDKPTTREESWKISREKGFRLFDPVTGAWVSRIKLLPPEEAEKFKGTIYGFSFEPEGK